MYIMFHKTLICFNIKPVLILHLLCFCRGTVVEDDNVTLTQIAEVTVGPPLGGAVSVPPLRLHLERKEKKNVLLDHSL